MKKTLSLILALALCLALGLPAWADKSNVKDTDIAYAVTDGNIYFRESNYTITGCDATVTEAIIPDTINGQPVLSILGARPTNGYGAFAFCNQLKTVVIPESITKIDQYTFYTCTSLTQIILPEAVSSIGSSAFWYCSNLSTITILNPEIRIGGYAFAGCKNLDAVYFNGSEAQWKALSIDGGNQYLTSAYIHYNSTGPGTADPTPATPSHTHSMIHYAAKAASCTESGNLEYWYCTDCGKYFSDAGAANETTLTALTVAPLGHNYVNGVCTRDGAIDPNYVAPHVHTLTHTAAKAATCTESGNLEYWYCAGCGKYFSDAGAANETTLTALTVTPLGHNYVDGVCTRCGEADPNHVAPTPAPTPGETHVHTLTYTAAKAATCTEGGNLQYWYCTGCGKYFSDASGVNETTLARVTLNALGHNYVNGVCTRCGEAEPGYVAPLTPSDVHFQKSTLYYQGQFDDVPANQWYTDSVAEAVELGLMKGNGDGSFNPGGDVTLAEAITMAARIHSIYTTGKDDFGTGSPWWQPYLDYAYNNGVINWAYYNADVTQKATRAQFAEIFANALPAEALTAMNHVADDSIPDVPMRAAYAEYVYKLYRAGILVGSDVNGTFYAQTYITRAEAAAIVSRMAESNNRVSLTLG